METCDYLKFQHPFTCIVSGTTSSGKTKLVRQILSDWKYIIKIKSNKLRVMWCFGQMQDLYKVTVKNVEMIYYEGVPTLSDIQNLKPDIIVMDDLMDEVKKDVVKLFTRGSHHLGISVFFIVQNLFNTNLRTISLNSHYIIIMKGLRTTHQVEFLARQIFPGKSKSVLSAYKLATQKPYGYLLIDLHPNSLDQFRLRTRILHDDVSASSRDKHSCTPIYFDINLEQ